MRRVVYTALSLSNLYVNDLKKNCSDNIFFNE